MSPLLQKAPGGDGPRRRPGDPAGAISGHRGIVNGVLMIAGRGRKVTSVRGFVKTEIHL
jgi:hypothetical protein